MKRFVLTFVLPLLVSGAVRWQALQSDYYNLVYPEGYESEARRAVRWLETERGKVNDLVGYDPGKVWIVIEDMGTTVNGFSNPVGNEIHLFTTPPSGLDLATRDWMRTVGIHEYAHEVSLSSVWGLPKVLGILLGPWVIPNMVTPGWLIEGVTVYTESHVLPYEGRLEAGEFDANVLGRAAQGVPTKSWNMNGSLFEYPLGAIYAYGGPFYEWLVATKGEEAVATFYKKHGSRIPLFSLDRSARQAFGERFPALLRDWQRSVRERATSYVPADSAASRLTHEGWYIFGTPAGDGQRLYFSRAHGKKLAAGYGKFYSDVVALDPETGEEVLIRPMSIIDLPLRVHEDVLYYAATITARGFANTAGSSFGELKEIRAYDLDAHRESGIYRGRVRGFDRLPDGSLLVSRDRENAAFGSALLIIPANGGEVEKIWEGEFLIGEIVISDKGETYCSARHQGENWDIYRFSSSDSTWTQLTHTPYSEVGFSLDPQGRLLFSANPYGTDGVSGAYVLDPQSGTIEQFKTPSYSLNPVMARGKLCFISLNPRGYDLYSVEPQLSPALFPSVVDQSPTEPSWNGEFKKRSSLSPYLTLLRPWIRVPYAIPEFADPLHGDWALVHLPLGMYFMGADVLGENSYSFFADYDVVGNAPSAGLSWSNTRFGPLSLNLSLNLNPEWLSADSLTGYTYTIYPYLSLPLVERQGRGLQSISWSEGFYFSGGVAEGGSVRSSLVASFAWPYVSLATNLWHSWSSPIFAPYEASYLGNRSVVACDLAGGVLIGDVSTTLNISADREGDTMSTVIRGYESLKTGDSFLQTATLEYRHRLIKMRFGIWNPNIFFEDLYISVFADAAYDSHQLLGASLGAMLTPEIHLIWGLIPIMPSFGVAFTRELKPEFVFNLGLDLPFGAKLKESDALRFVNRPGPDFN